MQLAVQLSRDKYVSFHSLMVRGYLITLQKDKKIMFCHVTLFTGSPFLETEYVHSMVVSVSIWGQDEVVI